MRASMPTLRHTGQAIAMLFALALPACGTPTLELADAPVGAYRMEESHTRVLFGVPHLGLSTYWVQVTRAKGSLDFDPTAPEASVLSVTVDPASVMTGDPEFDKELQGSSWFDTADHPEIRFVSTRIQRTGENTGTVWGKLTLRGVTKEIALDVTFNGSMLHPFAQKRALGFSATGTIKRSEFGMDHLVLFGIGDDVKLMLEAEFILGD